MCFEFTSIGWFLIIALGLSFVILGSSYLVVLQKGDIEKLSPYECGFQPFQDARQEFDVRFYVVAILFLIFDLELSYLFPWCVSLDLLPNLGYGSMVLFLIVLTIGFLYEWKKGALDW